MNRVFSASFAWLAVASLATSVPVHPAAPDDGSGYAVVVHAGNPETRLTRDAVSRLFLKKTATWAHGIKCSPVDLPRADDTRERFTREIHGKSVGAIRSYWQRMVFSGSVTPAPELDTDARVLEFVARTPGAIGYVSAGSVLDDRVRAIEIVD